MFLTSLMQLKNSYFSDGVNSTKAGMIDYVLEKVELKSSFSTAHNIVLAEYANTSCFFRLF